MVGEGGGREVARGERKEKEEERREEGRRARGRAKSGEKKFGMEIEARELFFGVTESPPSSLLSPTRGRRLLVR
jgi:hypothetical protein